MDSLLYYKKPIFDFYLSKKHEFNISKHLTEIGEINNVFDTLITDNNLIGEDMIIKINDIFDDKMDTNQEEDDNHLSKIIESSSHTEIDVSALNDSSVLSQNIPSVETLDNVMEYSENIDSNVDCLKSGLTTITDKNREAVDAPVSLDCELNIPKKIESNIPSGSEIDIPNNTTMHNINDSPINIPSHLQKVLYSNYQIKS